MAAVQPRDTRLMLTLRAVVAKALKQVDDGLRASLVADTGDDPDDAMTPGERKDVHLRDADGRRVKVATVRVDTAPVSAKVTDERAFVAWVRENAPTELVDAVRESYTKRLLAQVKDDPDGRAMNPAGELVQVPGITREVGDPKVVVSPAAGAADAIADAWRRGDLPQWDGLMREIGPGEGAG